MSNRNTDSTQGDSGLPPAPAGALGPPDPWSRSANTVFKSGPLFISSKGIGWTSWKKRWFILTRTSLVFFRTDPNAVPQKGSEVNLTLGGIDLNNSGSVVIKEDKKLLTVLFPDGRDGRAFTLKAETLDNLHEWKDALENALKQAPNAALGIGQNGILNNEQNETTEAPAEQVKEEEPPMKSMVVGRPLLLALEDIDGSPSFLEKALRFIEEHGVKVEGILRQAAAVDDVELRVQEYEKGKCEFSSEEDAHIIADCVKYILRELPSSPVPASCCNALLEACRTDRSNRVNAMRGAICDTFPEPNRRLLQRILTMMQTVAAHKAANRMSMSAVAACMAPLLLRPLLAGDCELESDFDVGGDGSIQLLQAAAAANHAQAIVITLLEEYDSIFGEGSLSPEMYTDTEGSESGSEEGSYEDESYEDDYEDGEDYEPDASFDGDTEGESALSCSENGDPGDNLYSEKDTEVCSVGSGSPKVGEDVKKNIATSPQDMSPEHDNLRKSGKFSKRNGNSFIKQGKELDLQLTEAADENAEYELDSHAPPAPFQKSTTLAGKLELSRRRTAWGRTAARKNLSMESIDYGVEEEVEIQKLEATKAELQNRIAEEAKENASLRASLEKRKNSLLERRLALEQDVKRLQEQLQKERHLRAALEAGLKNPQASMPSTACLDVKTKAGLEEIARVEADVGTLKGKIDDLGNQLSQQREQNFNNATDHEAKLKDEAAESTASLHINDRSTRSKVQRDNNLDELETENGIRQELASLTEKDLSDKRTERNSSNRKTDRDSSEKKTDGDSSNKKTERDSSDEKTARESSDGKPERDPSDKKTERDSHWNQQSDQARDKKSSTSSGSNSKKSGSKVEDSNTTSSALSKITTRIHFLKEKRSQIANELQNHDKGRGSDHSGQSQGKGKVELRQSSLQEKYHGSEFQSSTDSDNKELRSSKSLNNPDTGTGTDVKSQGKGKK